MPPLASAHKELLRNWKECRQVASGAAQPHRKGGKPSGLMCCIGIAKQTQRLSQGPPSFKVSDYLNEFIDPIYNSCLMKQQMSDPEREFNFFLFVNPTSGNKQGEQYMTLAKLTNLKFESGVIARVHLLNIFIKQAREEAFLLINKLCKSMSQIRIIICGGDGSITWVISQALENGVDLSRVVFGVIPIGTGNDFSRTLGWGYKAVNFDSAHIGGLARILQQWIQAKITKFDVWDVEIELYPNGNIFDIKNQVEIEREDNSVCKMFTNYVGIGLDARVVYTVESRRTKSAFLNKVVYACVGLCNFFRSMKKLEEVVQSFDDSDFQEEENTTQELRTNKIVQGIDTPQLRNELIPEVQSHANDERFLEPPTLQEEEDRELPVKKYHLKRGYRGIVCLNISSYMAGIRKVWRTRSKAVERDETDYVDQCFYDGKVQFVSFKSELNLALERITRQASRVTQGSGPFLLTMKSPKQGSHEETFIQIDGQSMKVRNMRTIRISKTRRFAGSQINVMYRQ